MSGWAFSQKVYDHWKLALLSYFVVSVVDSVLRAFNPTFPNFAIRIIIEVATLLAWAPGALYIFGEFVRLLFGQDPSSKRLVRTLVVGYVLFVGFGVAVPNTYNIALDAFQVTLPSPPMLRYLLNGGDLAGKLTMGIGAVYARGVGPTDIPDSEPEKAESIRAWLAEGLAPIGFAILMFGFVIGFGILALAAFIMIISGAVLLSIGLIIRRRA